METKRCSGCKSTKTLNNFYKNKLVLDGHSNYCVVCTKENSKKYFQKKKEKLEKSESDNFMKMVLLNNFNNDIENFDTDNLMRLLLIEKMSKSILNEVQLLKEKLIKSNEIFNVES